MERLQLLGYVKFYLANSGFSAFWHFVSNCAVRRSLS